MNHRRFQDLYLPPCFHSHPSLSGLKKVCIRSLPSSSGILKGSVFILSYKLCNKKDISPFFLKFHQNPSKKTRFCPKFLQIALNSNPLRKQDMTFILYLTSNILLQNTYIQNDYNRSTDTQCRNLIQLAPQFVTKHNKIEVIHPFSTTVSRRNILKFFVQFR